jgi:hypothetical protein
MSIAQPIELGEHFEPESILQLRENEFLPLCNKSSIVLSAK